MNTLPSKRSVNAGRAAARDADVMVDIVIEDETWSGHTGVEATIEEAARAAFAAGVCAALEQDAFDAECASVTIALLSDAAVRALNRQYRGKDKPTNVLSFPAHSAGVVPDEAWPLGDVVLAHETVAAEAHAAGVPFLDHVCHLVVHGVLHLLGYDHETDAEAEVMEGAETRILATLGVADPYAE